MATVPLAPIGAPRDQVCDDRTFAEYREALAEREQLLGERRELVHAGWGQKYLDRLHSRNKLSARERLARLVDPGTELFEVGTFVNWGLKFGERELASPGAGVVTAFAQVEGRWCMVIANDNTVASGSWWPQTPEKIERAQTMALRLRLPTIYLVDCSGLFLPEQSRSFPGATGAGHIFKQNALLSAHGVAQIAGVFGDCIAGGGYMPIISDRVYMTEQAYMVIAGAALIKGAKSQKITSLDIGGPEVHVHQSGCADVRVPNDEVALACIRREIAKLPSSGADYHRHGAGPMAPFLPARELAGLIPPDHREVYDSRQVLARLCDQSLFWELMPDAGEEMITGVGRVGGLYAGFIINRQGLVDDPNHRGDRKRPASILYRQGIAKISAFSRACNADGIPIIWLQDISGFDVGAQAEAQGLLGYGSSLIYTNSTNETPMFTVLLRKASGAGYYAMAGLPYDPVVQLSTAISRLSVMEGRTLAIATYNSKLDDDFEIVSQDPAERAEIEAGMTSVAARIEQDMDPWVAGRQMDTDEIVRLDELRPWLAALVEMAYQNAGSRRIKNPRIWSLHDLEVLAGGRARADLAATMTATATAGTSEDDNEGQTILGAPAPGYWHDAPRPGALLRPGDALGSLEILGVHHRLLVPEGAVGVVVAPAEPGPDDGLSVRPVDYRAPLLTLDPNTVAGGLAHTNASAQAGEADGSLVFRAPSSGRFYRRPAPDKPNFVELGQVIERGQTLGLLEVMKTFTRLNYDDPKLPARAKVTALVAEDQQDLDSGAVILRLESAD